MIDRSLNPKSFLGHWEAEQDEELFETFVRFRAYEKLKHRETTLVLGTKGSGKSALVRMLSRELGECHINFVTEEIHFDSVFRYWHKMRMKGSSDAQFLIGAWKHLFYLVAMTHIFVKQDEFQRRGAANEHLRAIQAYLQAIGIASRHGQLKTSRGITAIITDTLARVLEFFSNDKLGPESEIAEVLRSLAVEHVVVQKAITALDAVLKECDTSLIITFDGFDSFFELSARGYEFDNSKQGTVQEMLLSLLDATRKLAAEPLGRRLSVKVVFPRDKYPVHYRDRIKDLEFAETIWWTPDQLFEFCCRRISRKLGLLDATGLASSNPEESWFRVFPRMTDNRGHTPQRQEDSFDYVLRHTHYRPRDLQVQVYMILDEFFKERLRLEKDQLIPSQVIQRGIVTGNAMLTSAVLDEYGFEYPYLDELFTQFHGLETVFSYSDSYPAIRRCRDILRRYAVNENKEEVKEAQALRLLYDVGFLGTVEVGQEIRSAVRRVEGKQYRCTFYNDKETNELSTINEREFLCIHPIFHERYRILGSKEFIVGGGLRSR